jgi:23S rRNA (pseudouridine1915-N3)-methyltransferase
MDIKIIAVGKLKSYFQEALNDYTKRIKSFCNLKIIEVKETNTDDIEKNIRDEANAIKNHLNNNDYLITLEIEGQLLDSVFFANKIQEHYLYSDRPIVFIIGGSNGIAPELRQRANEKISFGKFTYPHQLMRVILVEQIYRAIMINNNSKYHK